MSIHHLATRFCRNSHQIGGYEPLDNEALYRHVPSIFAREAHDSRSERYVYVPTIDIVEGLRREGWFPFFAVQSVPRDGSRHGHAKQYSQILIAIGRKGDLTSKVRESLVSIGRLVTFLSAVVEGVKWSKDMREQLKTMQRDVASLTDHASYLSNKITFVLDAMLGVVNLEQNNIIKLFSVMAVVLMPPTLIASIYGMNFKDMPELGWDYGYPVAVLAMIAAAVVPYYIFKLKKWL